MSNNENTNVNIYYNNNASNDVSDPKANSLETSSSDAAQSTGNNTNPQADIEKSLVNEVEINTMMRIGFVRKVFGIVLFQLLITIILSSLTFFDIFREFFLNTMWFLDLLRHINCLDNFSVLLYGYSKKSPHELYNIDPVYDVFLISDSHHLFALQTNDCDYSCGLNYSSDSSNNYVCLLR